jgi:pimeloyl-ACP methyl ester carboxylesterase
MGQADIADVRAHCGAINAGIRGSTREFVKDTGHLIQLEKPDEVAKRIEEFAQGCEWKRAR